MSNETILLIVLIVVIVGVLPSWPHSSNWGYTPSGLLGLLLVFFLIWAVVGGRPLFRSSAAQDLKSAGREAAETIRHAVQ
jgi:hypothetical protein